MRGNYRIIKWMAGQIRPFIMSFILIILSGAVLSLCGVGIAIVSKELIDAATLGIKKNMIRAIIVFGMLIFIQVGIQMIITPIISRIQENISNQIRKNLFVHILHSSWLDFSKYHSGDLITRLTRDIGMMSNILVNIIPNIFSLGVGLVAAFITLFYYEPILALLAFVLGPAAVAFSRIFGRRIKKFHIGIQETEGKYRSFIHESIQNLLIVKSFCVEDKNVEKIDKLQNDMVGLVFKRSRISSATNSVLSIGYWVGYFLAFGWGILRLSVGKTSFGTLAAFLQLVGQVQGAFIGLAYSYPRIISAMASAGRLIELENIKSEKTGMKRIKWKSAGIVFDNVSFSYDMEKAVLKNVSIEIKPNETVAVIGPSGEGKTTIIRLILSFIKPTNGNVYFIDPDEGKFEANPECRRLISYVPQGNTLFSGTIAENLRLGFEDAGDGDIEKALKRACAYEFVNLMPEGINTLIGERGLGLSEGQAQRIAIARAFLHNTPILILDEATSALDIETEKKILYEVGNLEHAPTCIIISHRKSALEVCNRIIRLEEGRISEIQNKVIEAAATEAVWNALLLLT